MTHFLHTNSKTEAHTSATGISILNIGQCELHCHDNSVTFSLSEVVRQIVFLHSPGTTAGEGVVPSAPLYLISKT